MGVAMVFGIVRLAETSEKGICKLTNKDFSCTRPFGEKMKLRAAFSNGVLFDDDATRCKALYGRVHTCCVYNCGSTPSCEVLCAEEANELANKDQIDCVAYGGEDVD